MATESTMGLGLGLHKRGNTTGLGGAASGGTPPDEVAGLLYWYDFADASSLTLRNSGGFDYIEEVLDKSANGNTISQAVQVNQPTLVSGLNGKTKYKGDNSLGTYLKSNATVNHSSTKVMTILIVCDFTMGGLNREVLNLSGSSNGDYRILPSASGSIIKLTTKTNGSVNSFDSPERSGTQLLSFQIDLDNPSATEILNIAFSGNGNINYSNTPTTDNTSGMATASLYVGARSAGANVFDEGIHEIIAYNSLVSEEDMNGISLYLADKYKLPYLDSAWLNSYSVEDRLSIALNNYTKDQIDLDSTKIREALELHLDYTDESTMSLRDDGGTKYVETITGKDKNSTLVEQVTTTKQPVFSNDSSGWNGNDYVSYDGATQGMQTNANLDLSGTNQMTTISVGKVMATGVGQVFMEMSNDYHSNDNTFLSNINSSNALQSALRETPNYYQERAIDAFLNSVGGINVCYISRYNRSKVDMISSMVNGLYGNAYFNDTLTTATVDTPFASDTVNFGARDNATALFFEVELYKQLIYNTEFTLKMSSWLNDKYESTYKFISEMDLTDFDVATQWDLQDDSKITTRVDGADTYVEELDDASAVHTMQQTVLANQGKLLSDTIGQYIEFLGAQDYSTIGNVDLSATDNLAMIIVGEWGSSGVSEYPFTVSETTTTKHFSIYKDGADKMRANAKGNVGNSRFIFANASDLPKGVASITSANVDFGLASAEVNSMMADGEIKPVTTSSNSNNTGSFADDTLHLGWNGLSGEFAGKIYEVILTSRVLTVLEIGLLHKHLSEKYGIEVSNLG